MEGRLEWNSDIIITFFQQKFFGVWQRKIEDVNGRRIGEKGGIHSYFLDKILISQSGCWETVDRWMSGRPDGWWLGWMVVGMDGW